MRAVWGLGACGLPAQLASLRPRQAWPAAALGRSGALRACVTCWQLPAPLALLVLDCLGRFAARLSAHVSQTALCRQCRLPVKLCLLSSRSRCVAVVARPWL